MIQKITLTVVLGIIVLSGAFIIKQKLPISQTRSTPQSTTNPNQLPSATSSTDRSLIKVSPKPAATSTLPLITVTTNNSGQTRVEISQDNLNNEIKTSLVGQSLSSTPLGAAIITDTSLIINNGFIHITGKTKNGPLELPFQTKATITLIHNQPQLNLSELALNDIPLPQLVADQLANSLQAKVSTLINSYNFQVQSIDLQPGKIILTGQK